MISRFRVVLCAALLSLFVVLERPCLAVNDLSPESFLQEYRNAIKQSQIANRNIQLEGILSRTIFRNNEQKISEEQKRVLYAANQGREKIMFHVGKPDDAEGYAERVFVLGCDRNFLLGRSSPQGNFQVLEIIADSNRKRSQLANDLAFTADLTNSLSGIPLLQMIESKNFKVIEIKQNVIGNHHFVRVEFDYRPNAYEDAELEGGVFRGWMLVDPERNWVVREYEYKATSAKSPDVVPTYTGAIRYKIEEDGTPLPEEATCIMKYVQSNGETEIMRLEYHFQAERLSTDPIPDSEFTLAAYGLGDFEQPPGAPTNTLPYWAFGFAAVALGISVVLKRMARQA